MPTPDSDKGTPLPDVSGTPGGPDDVPPEPPASTQAVQATKDTTEVLTQMTDSAPAPIVPSVGTELPFTGVKRSAEAVDTILPESESKQRKVEEDVSHEDLFGDLDETPVPDGEETPMLK